LLLSNLKQPLKSFPDAAEQKLLTKQPILFLFAQLSTAAAASHAVAPELSDSLVQTMQQLKHAS
jgi:hypothetical protein